MADKIQNLRAALEFANRDVPSTKEVAESIAKVIKAVKEARVYLEQQAEDNKEELTDIVASSVKKMDRDLRSVESALVGKLENIKNKLKDESDNKLDSFAREIYQEIRALERTIPSQTDLSEVFNQIEEVKSQIQPTVTAEEVRDKLEDLEGDERLDKSAIKGLEKDLTEIKQTGVKILGGARGVQLYIDGEKKGQAAMFNLIAGPNVTITHSHAHGRNDITISASVTGSGSFSVLTATGDIDDSNTSFTFASEPAVVIVNGASYRNGKGCTISGTDVTLDYPVGTGGDIYAIG